MNNVDSRKIYVDPSKVRTEDQLAEYERIFKDGICPFCVEHRDEYTQGNRLYDGEHWWLFENNWPYKNTRRHIMAVAKQHEVYIEDTTSGAGNELLAQYQKIEQADGFELAAIEARFGFVMWTGASVAHLHTHLLVPESLKEAKGSYIEQYHLGERLWSGESWYVYKNMQPHEHARVHLLIVSKNEATFLSDLKIGAGDELFDHLRKIETKFDFTHGGFHARIGKRAQSGDTSNHIVFEVVTPNDSVYDDATKKIRFAISESPAVDFKIST